MQRPEYFNQKFNVYCFALVVYLRKMNSCTTALASRPPKLIMNRKRPEDFEPPLYQSDRSGYAAAAGTKPSQPLIGVTFKCRLACFGCPHSSMTLRSA